ncbi:efflux RND transporter permease subunit, partial [Streptomyces sp. CHD11]|nr:efflux RND transporter permease subunit [Streptomyces sp. CHD11]
VLQKVTGAAEVKVEQTGGLPLLSVQIDRERAARYGLNVGDIQDVIATALGGRKAGTLFEGDRRFDLMIRLPETLRSDPAVLARLPIPLPAVEGRVEFIPLADVARLETVLGPNQISREDGKRLVIVSANVRDRDLGSFVADATAAITD